MGQLIFVSKLHMRIQYPRVHASSVMRYTKSMTSGCITRGSIIPFLSYIYTVKSLKSALLTQAKTKIRLGIWPVHSGPPLFSPLFHNIFLPVVRFSCLGRDQIFTMREVVIRDKH